MYGLVRVSVFCCVPSSTILVRVAGISSHTSPHPSRVSTRTNLHSCMWTSANHVPSLLFSSVQFSCSVVSDFAAPWTVTLQASLSFTISWSLLKLMSIESVMPSNHFNLCCPLLLLLSIFPSTRGFSSESVLHIRYPLYWSFSISISPSDE